MNASIIVQQGMFFPGWEVIWRQEGDFKDILLYRTRTREEAEKLAERERTQ